MAEVVAAGRPPFVGRDRELSTLDAALQAAVTGTTSMVVVGGEAGSGKSRLLDEFTSRVRTRDVEVMTGRAFPIVAAYAIETGDYRWSTCSAEQVWWSIVAATEEAVYLSWYTTTEQMAAFDADDGSDVAVGEVPANPDPASSHAQPETGFVVDGVRIEGGQDVPTRAFDDASGGLLWERPGVWVYSDVSAVGDGAVFALEPGVRLVGYELDSGEIRWEKPVVDPYSTSSWPWHVAGQRLFTLWFNAQVLSTVDGSLLWRTDYPVPTGPGDPTPLRMSGVRANDSTVFVSFSPVGSGGD